MSAHALLNFSASPLTSKLIHNYILDRLPALRPNSYVLEIGAGTCQASYLIKNARFERSFVIATDVSRIPLAAGKRLASMFRREVDDYVCCDATRLPFRDNSFELVFGAAVLHHMENPTDACTEIRRALTGSGGYIGLEGSVHTVLRLLAGMLTGAHYRVSKEHVREDMYDIASWRRIFEKANMRSLIQPIIAPSVYKEIVGMKVEPRSYRPRYRLRYPYERFLALLPKDLANALVQTILPASVLIEATSASNPNAPHSKGAC